MDTIKSLQDRAKAIASQFDGKARHSLVIEFAGVPKAGKTTILGQVQTFLKRCGFRTEVVVERASVCPIRDKHHMNFNVWTVCTTLSQILEKTQNPPREGDPQILFLDRGIFDAVCWMTMMEERSRIRRDQREKIEQFVLIDDWRKRISAVIVMLASASDSIKREQGLLPVDGSVGSIMNTDTLEHFRKTAIECIDRLDGEFRIYKIDTSFGETKDCPRKTAEVAVNTIIDLAEELIAEEILSCPSNLVNDVFGDKNFVDVSAGKTLIEYFTRGDPEDFHPREEVEDNLQRIQALPIVVVRNASGDVLRLRRREKKKDNQLHDKIVIWAGGHVRREDSEGGDPLISGAVRELEEELRLKLEVSDLKLLGAVYFDDGKRAARHVAIVYEWTAPTDDVLSSLEPQRVLREERNVFEWHLCPVRRISKRSTPRKNH